MLKRCTVEHKNKSRDQRNISHTIHFRIKLLKVDERQMVIQKIQVHIKVSEVGDRHGEEQKKLIMRKHNIL